MRKPDSSICKTKGADQLRSNCAADQLICFRYIGSTIPLRSKFKASNHRLWLYNPVCVGPSWKPEDKLSHDMAHIRNLKSFFLTCEKQE